jgi:hypothetical protein
MTPDETAWIANIRAEAAHASAWAVFVGGKVAIYPDEIDTRTDEELLEFIKGRLADSNTKRA